MSNPDASRAWVEVRTDALCANFKTIQAIAGVPVIAMVKADAYGVGVRRVVECFEPLDPLAYGVASVREGLLLRRLGVRRPLLVLGPLPPGAEAAAATGRLTPAASDLDFVRRWSTQAERLGEPLEYHVEIDTGMGRAGFDFREAGGWAEALRALAGPRLRWTGVFTHFHSADAADATATRMQWQRFQDVIRQLPVSREDLLVHAANSAAALRWREYAADAIRPGIFLYGGRAVAPEVAGVPAPEAVVAVRAKLVRVHEVPPGATAGYGATHVARGWERWGTLSIGYGDGLFRCLGNRGFCLIRGRRVPLIGRISMDMSLVDITSVPGAGVGDVATLIGRDGDEEITVDEVADAAGTIGYEVLTRLSRRLPRKET